MSGCIEASGEEDRNPAQSSDSTARYHCPGSSHRPLCPFPPPAEQSPWLSLLPACMRTQQCPSESSGAHSGENCSSSGSSGLSPGSDSDSSGVVCGGGGMRGVLSRYWSLESLHSATGKGLFFLICSVILYWPWETKSNLRKVCKLEMHLLVMGNSQNVWSLLVAPLQVYS